MDYKALPSIEFLQEIVLKKFREELHGKMTLKLLDLEMKTVTDSPGFMSYIVRVHLKWSRDENQNLLPQTLIYKIPSPDKFTDFSDDINSGTEQVTFVPKLHVIECQFYNLWREESCPCPIPICYLAQTIRPDHPGILIFQDLSTDGSVPRLQDGLSLDQVLQVVDNLAHLQAWSLKPQNRIKVPDIDFITLEQCGSFVEVVRNSCNEMQNRWPDWFPTMDQTLELFTAENFFYQFRPESYQQLGMEPVLVHGDVWAHNFMFTKDDGGAKLVALLDWQIIHFGVATEDLALLIFTSCAPELRRTHLERIIQHLYQTIAKDLGQQPPFSFEKLMESFQLYLKLVSSFLWAFCHS